MNKQELVRRIAFENDLTLKQARKILDSVLNAITDAVAKDKNVALIGFGTFTPCTRDERSGRNPQTNEAIAIPSCKTVKFKPGKAFKEFLNQ